MSSKNKLKVAVPGEDEEVERVFAPVGCRAVDALFRKNGYKIWSRAGNDEPIWEKKGVLFPQHEVEVRMNATDLADARHLEDLYKKGIR